jgi:hypothetical protein
MIEFEEKPISDELYEEHYTKLCMCECEACSLKSPHPIYNCYKECTTKIKETEYQRLESGVYKKCFCTCRHCLDSNL